MYKYLSFILFGIILFLIFNNMDTLNIGAPINQYYIVRYSDNSYRIITYPTIQEYVDDILQPRTNEGGETVYPVFLYGQGGVRLEGETVRYEVEGYVNIDAHITFQELQTNNVLRIPQPGQLSLFQQQVARGLSGEPAPMPEEPAPMPEEPAPMPEEPAPMPEQDVDSNSDDGYNTADELVTRYDEIIAAHLDEDQSRPPNLPREISDRIVEEALNPIELFIIKTPGFTDKPIYYTLLDVRWWGIHRRP